jgi:hypothetical protein
MTVLGKAVGAESGLALGRDVSASGLELPETIPDLAAWYDARDDRYFAFSSGASVSAWASRSGSLGTAPLLQATSGSQPARVTGVSALAHQSAVLFDGLDDYLAEASAPNWTFLHDNTGFTIFFVRRIDSTGPAHQGIYSTCGASTAQRGSFLLYRDNPLCQLTCGNGSGAWVYDVNVSNLGHSTRDVSAWQSFSYGGGVGTLRAATSAPNIPITANPPSALPPERGLHIGRVSSGVSYKGHVAQVLVYKRFLSALEVAKLASWAAPTYGVAA